MPFVPPTRQLVVEVFVRDLDRSLAFYTGLGFRLLRRDGGFAELQWEGHLRRSPDCSGGAVSDRGMGTGLTRGSAGVPVVVPIED